MNECKNEWIILLSAALHIASLVGDYLLGKSDKVESNSILELIFKLFKK